MLAMNIPGLDWLVAKLSDLLYGILNSLWSFIQSIGESAINGVLSFAQSNFPALDWAAIGSYLNSANYFFPLEESFGLAVVVTSIWGSVWAYRLVKSWIPFIGG